MLLGTRLFYMIFNNKQKKGENNAGKFEVHTY